MTYNKNHFQVIRKERMSEMVATILIIAVIAFIVFRMFKGGGGCCH
ncbi:hypothetical protein [Clostridium butyricum]|jgi:hypothetical protein|nr:hypothetical protein [Clostridium butyricum]